MQKFGVFGICFLYQKYIILILKKKVVLRLRTGRLAWMEKTRKLFNLREWEKLFLLICGFDTMWVLTHIQKDATGKACGLPGPQPPSGHG